MTYDIQGVLKYDWPMAAFLSITILFIYASISILATAYHYHNTKSKLLNCIKSEVPA